MRLRGAADHVPVVGGESIALRMLNRERLLRPLDKLGMSADALDR